MGTCLKTFIKSKPGEIDKAFYILGSAALCGGIISMLLFLSTGINVLLLNPPCTFHRITGLSCPGCGGTRAFISFLHGDIRKCLYYYPPLLYGIAVYIVFMARCTLYILFGFGKARDGAVLKYIYVFIALVLLQWTVKLVAQLCFGYDWYQQAEFFGSLLSCDNLC